MEHRIINTGDYLIVVDDSDIKEGDLYFDIEEKIIYKRVGYLLKLYDIKKIISHLPLNNSPILDGVDILPEIEDEKSLQQQKTPVAFECEMVDFEVDMGLGEECVEYSQYPKTTTNSQGLSQWVGEYVY